jgi:hypothetical protein
MKGNNMNTILSPLKDAIQSLITVVKDTAAALYTESNIRKENLRAALAAMFEARDTMVEFADTCEMLSTVAEISADMSAATEYVTDMIEEIEVFTSPIETFNGYCDNCGKELLTTDEVHLSDEVDFVCAECAHEQLIMNVDSE